MTECMDNLYIPKVDKRGGGKNDSIFVALERSLVDIVMYFVCNIDKQTWGIVVADVMSYRVGSNT